MGRRLPTLGAWAALVAALLAGAAWGAPGEEREALRALEAAVAANDADGACHAIERLGACNSRDALEALLDLGVRTTRPDDPPLEAASEQVFEAVVRALAGTSDMGLVRRTLHAGVRQADGWPARNLIILALAERDGPDDWEAVIAGLDRREPEHVQRAGIRALAASRLARAVDPILGVLERTEASGGLVPTEAREALARMTGQAFADAASARAWWTENRGRFDAAARLPEVRDPPEVPGGAPDAIASKRVVFILDMSTSMVGRPQESTDEPPRIARARRELERLVRGLGGDVRFTIVAFSREIAYLGGGGGFILEGRGLPPPIGTGLVAAGDAAKDTAATFIEAQQAGGTSWLDHGLRAAFLFDEADSFYLVSDGVPAHAPDQLLPAEVVLAEAGRLNRLRGARIHTLCLSPSHHGYGDLMRRLAAEHGGTHRDVE